MTGNTAAKVGEFSQAFDQYRNPTPTLIPSEIRDLRENLLMEEVSELVEAVATDDIIEIADALGDIAYILYGTALAYGIDLDAVISEIHRSNMSKLDELGRPIFREDGKVLKSKFYSPPYLAAVLDEQAPLKYGA